MGEWLCSTWSLVGVKSQQMVLNAVLSPQSCYPDQEGQQVLGRHPQLSPRPDLVLTAIEVRYYVRSLQPTMRAAKSIHLSLHIRNSVWDQNIYLLSTNGLRAYHIYRNGKVITFLPGKKKITFFSLFFRHTAFMHSL